MSRQSRTVQAHYPIDRTLHRQVRAAAIWRNQSLSAFVAQALRRECARVLATIFRPTREASRAVNKMREQRR